MAGLRRPGSEWFWVGQNNLPVPILPRGSDSGKNLLRRSRVGVKALVAFVVARDQLVVSSRPPGKLFQVVGRSGVQLARAQRRDADSRRDPPVRGVLHRRFRSGRGMRRRSQIGRAHV